MKYRIEWMREKKNVYWQSKQQCVVYDDESALHIMKNLQKDPKVSLIDVIPVLWQLVKLSTIVPTRFKTVYSIRVKGVQSMQVTSKRHSMVVEFRPHNILTDKFVYTLKFKGEAQSMRLMNKKEMVETINARLDLHGYTVTDFLTEPQEYFPAAC